MNHITLILKSGVDIEQSLKLLEKIPGVNTCVQVFPNDEDQELIRFAVLKLYPGIDSKKVLREVEDLEITETAEVAPVRRLVTK